MLSLVAAMLPALAGSSLALAASPLGGSDGQSSETNRSVVPTTTTTKPAPRSTEPVPKPTDETSGPKSPSSKESEPAKSENVSDNEVEALKPKPLSITKPGKNENLPPTGFEIKGKGPDTKTVTVTAAGKTLCTAVVNGSMWNCTASESLPSGESTITASAPGENDAQVDVTVSPVKIEKPQNGATVDPTKLPISGKGPKKTKITVTNDGTELCSHTSNSSGDWHCTSDKPLNGATPAIVATAANGSTDQVQVNVETSELKIDSPAENDTISPDATISGTAKAGKNVRVYNNGTEVCKATADNNKQWTCPEGTRLAAGPASLIAKAITQNDSKPVNVTVATRPVITAPKGGPVPTDVKVAGTANPKTWIRVLVDGRMDAACSTHADDNGAWSCEIGLAPGAHSLAAHVGVSEVKSQPVNVTAGVRPAIDSPKTGDTVANEDVTISGRAGAYADVVVNDQLGHMCSAKADFGGHWSCHVAKFGVGTKRLTAMSNNIASDPVTAEGFIRPQITSLPSNGIVPASEEFEVSGTTFLNQDVRVSNNTGELCLTKGNHLDKWSCKVKLSPGKHTLIADTKGVKSAPVAVEAVLRPQIMSPTNGDEVRIDSTISGSAEEHQQVAVFNGDKKVCDALGDVHMKWSCPAKLQPGKATLVADTKGVRSAPVGVTVLEDGKHVINPPTIDSPARDAKVGSKPVFSGKRSGFQQVTVSENGKTICIAAPGMGETWSCAAEAEFATGRHSVTATATERTGESSKPSETRSFEVIKKNTPTPPGPTPPGPIPPGPQPGPGPQPAPFTGQFGQWCAPHGCDLGAANGHGGPSNVSYVLGQQPSWLATTGVGAAALAVLAAMLLAGGAVAIWAARRRQGDSN